MSIFVLFFSFFGCDKYSARPRVLIFNKTEFYFHENNSDAIEALREICTSQNFAVDVSDDAEVITDEDLRRYTAVIFLNTAGNILNAGQEEVFQRYIHAGGGFAGLHTAIDTEHNWDWYGRLIGARFDSRSEVERAKVRVENRGHPANGFVDSTAEFVDEWFNIKEVSPDISILLTLDEGTYRGGNMGSFHPVSWCHEFEGGRAFITTMGHTVELYRNPVFLSHLAAGLKYIAGDGRLPDYSRLFAATDSVERSASKEFVKTCVVCDLYEPMEMDMFPDGKIIFIERRGAIKLYDPGSGTTREAGNVDVYIKGEEGLLGLAIDPEWERNHWIYLFYTPRKDRGALRLSRFVFEDGSLRLSSEKILLKVPTFDAEPDYHVAGSLEFDASGFLYVAIGDNAHHLDGYSLNDERKGYIHNDAQHTAANSMDLRGKILRIRPLPDGSYLCPAGNLYTGEDIVLPSETDRDYRDTALQRKLKGGLNKSVLDPRQPFDQPSESGFLSVGNSLPPAFRDSLLKTYGRPEIFVMGVRNPFRIAYDNRRKTLYWGDVGPDAGFDDSLRGPQGYDEVNAASVAGFYGWPYQIGPNLSYRQYDLDTRRSGPYYNPDQPVNTSPNNTGARYLPPARPALIYYPFSSSKDFPLLANGARCIMAGPTYYSDTYPENSRFPDRFDGKLIIYDWIRNWVMAVTLDSMGRYMQMEPLARNLRVSAPVDMIIDKNGSLWVLEYGSQWYLRNPDACLSRIDFLKGGSETEAPEYGAQSGPVAWEFFNRNRSFYERGDQLHYQVKFEDPSSESLVSTNLDIQFVETDLSAYRYIQRKKQDQGIGKQISAGQSLIDKSDCRACHALDRKINGPTYLEISSRYRDDKTAVSVLAEKVIRGGRGNWGHREMVAHPQFSDQDAREVVKWILSLQEKPTDRISKEGRYTFNVPRSSPGKEGLFVFSSSLADGRGSTVVFRPVLQQVERADSVSRRFPQYKTSKDGVVSTFNDMRNFDFFALKEVDLRGIKTVDCRFQSSVSRNHTGGGVLEMRLDGAAGPILGSTVIPPSGQLSESESPLSSLLIETDRIPADGKLHDVFFVIKRDNAGSKAVTGIDWIKFNLK